MKTNGWRRNPKSGIQHAVYGPGQGNQDRTVCGLIATDRLDEDDKPKAITRPCLDCIWSLGTSHLRVTGQLL